VDLSAEAEEFWRRGGGYDPHVLHSGKVERSRNISAAREFLRWWFQDEQYNAWFRVQDGPGMASRSGHAGSVLVPSTLMRLEPDPRTRLPQLGTCRIQEIAS
jgi:hypothetical protein